MNGTDAQYDMTRSTIGGDSVMYKENNMNHSQNNEFTIQADYVQPLKNPKQKIETGLKYINRDITSNFELQYWDPAKQIMWLTQVAQIN